MSNDSGASPAPSSLWLDTPEHRASVAYWAGRRESDWAGRRESDPEDATAEAMLCAFGGDATHWPTVAGHLADEVERLREWNDNQYGSLDRLGRHNAELIAEVKRLHEIERATGDYVRAVDRGRALDLPNLGLPIAQFQPMRAALGIGPFLGCDDCTGDVACEAHR